MDLSPEDEDVKARKMRILRKISEDIENGAVYENKLEQLEIIENLLAQEGLKASESMKEAYSAVARECTAKYIVCAGGKKPIYIDAIKRIWLRRIMGLFEKGSSLISPVLKNCAKEVNVAMYDEQVCQSLREDNTRNKALLSLKRFVTEQLTQMDQNSPDILARHCGSDFDVFMREPARETVPETGSTIVYEISSESDECKNLGDEHSNEKHGEDGDRFFDAEMEPQKEVSNNTVGGEDNNGENGGEDVEAGAEAKERAGKHKSRAYKDPSKMKACKRLRKLPDYFYGVEELNTEHARGKEPKQCLIDRNRTARTYEWEDSIEEASAEIGSDEGRPRLRSPRRIVVSPLRKNQPTKGANRRKRVAWEPEETEALKEGVARYGRQWKKIKLAFEIILARRTEVDLKDKYRVEMKRDEAFGEAPESKVWEWKAES